MPWSTATVHYRPSKDGLSQPWFGHVWLNPPYSDPGPWMERMAEHDDGVALIFARTETGWWQRHVWPHGRAFLFLAGRLSFVEPKQRERNGHNAPAPSVLVGFGSWGEDAVRACGLNGALVQLAARRGVPVTDQTPTDPTSPSAEERSR